MSAGHRFCGAQRPPCYLRHRARGLPRSREENPAPVGTRAIGPVIYGAGAPSSRSVRLRPNEGARNAGCQTHPQPRVQSKKHTSIVTTNTPDIRRSARNGFNSVVRDDPRWPALSAPPFREPLWPRRLAKPHPVPHGASRSAGMTRLSPSATASTSALRAEPHGPFRESALPPVSTPDATASTASRPASCDVAQRPSNGTE